MGWIGVGPARDDDAPASVELWSLYVAPEHQGSGVAGELVEAFLPAGPVYLWVLEGNHRAITLVSYLRLMPWQLPEDFTVDRYADQLLEMHDSGEPPVFTEGRFLLECRRSPAGTARRVGRPPVD